MKLESTKSAGFEGEKDKQWNAISLNVESVKDRRGKGIDEKIKFATVALKANGFGTTGSCEGHVDRAFPWPWIDVESPLAEKLLSDLRYIELKNKARAMVKDGKEMLPEEKAEYQELVDKQIEENKQEYHRLQSLLVDFYKIPTEEAKGGSRLIIEKGSWNQSCLQPEGLSRFSRLGGEEAQKFWPEELKGKNLELYRKEMNRFAEFLKERFFNQQK